MSDEVMSALRSDLAALQAVLPVIEASGSRTTTIDVAMLRRLYDAAVAHLNAVLRDQGKSA